MNTAKYLVFGFFAAIIAGIVFVQAGKGGNLSGGQQTGMIINAGAGGLAQLASSLETGTAPGQ